MLPPFQPAAVKPREAWLCRIAALFLLLVAAGLRLAYLAHDCPLDLAPDEAHYWDWSRHLDWSYYSKGPLVAWLIRASCDLFGPWSVALTGNEMLAVRLPAVLCGSLLLLSLYVLTVQVYGSDRLALGVLALGLTFPVIAAGSSLMTIDSPYTCCWGWALVLGHRAIFRGSAWAWPAAGLVVALGILAKYNMVLWPPSVALFLLTSRAYRPLLFRRGFWGMTLVAALGCLPILIWNFQNDWVTLRHLTALSTGMRQESSFHWTGPLAYVVGQCALLLVFWFVAWAAAMVAHRPWVEGDAGKRYLWWLSLPMFAVFLAFSPKTRGGELNWPVAAYLSGLVLAAGWLARQLRSPQRWYRRLTAGTLATTVVVGLALTVFVHRSDWLRPVLEPLSGPVTSERPYPLRRFDPTCRLKGWRTLAAEVDRVREELRKKEGEEPILVATAWFLPGELGFYCTGHPTVYSIGLAQGDRHSQYDLWRPNPIHDAKAFRGRTFVIVGGPSSEVLAGFATAEAPRQVTHTEAGRPLAGWTVTVCRNF
ncbi:MAG TPA: glycosyltransferase family 39 protein, partial [Gemmataceae bacterium]|nr:glycosyltransferase family 39 protein [Gemmataceae bacterium]